VNRDDFILIGKIVGAHGLNGTSKVLSFAESPAIFETVGSLTLRLSDHRTARYDIDWVKPHKRNLLIAFKQVTDRSQAERLVGSELLVEKTSLPALEKDTYYWFDIMGSSVFTIDGDYLGRVASIFATGSNDVYVVKPEDGQNPNEILIPAIESVIVEVDVENKLLRVDLPEGLR
jgi:16S rRNA processing protein RimM